MSDNSEAGCPMLSITEAAEATGVHRRDIRRLLDAGRLPNAYMVSGPQRRSVWNIPVTDLVAAGLRVHSIPDDNTASNGERRFERLRRESGEERARAETAEAEAVDELELQARLKDAEREVERLRQELDEERTRREAAEAIVEERARALENAEADVALGIQLYADQATTLHDAERELDRLRQELDEERTHRRLAEIVAADRASALVNYEELTADQARALEDAQAAIAALKAQSGEPPRSAETNTAQRRWWVR
jgi:excisionase family DNA binding protein